MTHDFKDLAKREMAKQSEAYRYSHIRFPEPPPPTCHECDTPIPEDEWCGPDTPTECEDCRDS